MVIAALLFFIAGVYVLVRPEEVLIVMGLAAGGSTTEVAALLGVLLMGLGVHQATTSRHAGDPAFRRAAILSILVQAGLAVLLYLSSGAATTTRTVVTAVCGFFALVYLVTLPIKPVGYREQPTT
jgi:hypothetical protein